MCRIGIVQELQRRVVSVAGRLTAEQVPELLMICSGAPYVLTPGERRLQDAHH